MKRSVFILLLLLSAQTAFAQIDFGPRVALTASRLNLVDFVPKVSAGNFEIGYQAGLFLRIQPKNWKWYVQPELLYTNLKAETNIGSGVDGYEFESLDFPLLIGRNIGPVRVNAGPSLRKELTNERTMSDGSVIFLGNRGRKTLGYQAGAGIDVMRFMIDLKYEGSFRVVDDQGGVGVLRENPRPYHWVLVVGYKLF